MALRGRPPFIITPLAAFITGVEGNPPIKPFHGEFVADTVMIEGRAKGDGSLGYINEISDSEWEFISVTQDISDFIKQMEYTGIFENAAAGVFSRDLTYFFFNNDNKSVVLNQNLTYPGEYRYYAIRSGTTYLTGKIINGVVATNLVDMKTTPANVGNGLISKPEAGIILPNASIVDGSNYIIEFYDANKTMISRDVFYAESVKLMTNDLAGDVGIVRMIVTTTRPMTGKPDAAFLYRGENYKQISLNVYLEFADGSTRNVTHESTNGSGRLTIVGLDRIVSNVVSGPTTNQKFTVTYYASNSDGVVSANTFYSKDIDVYILEDDTAAIDRWFPVYWVTLFNSVATMNRKLFVTRPNGTVADITATIKDTTTVIQAGSSSDDIVSMDFNLGITGQVPENKKFRVRQQNRNVGISGASILQCGVSRTDSAFSSDIYSKINYSVSNNKGTIAGGITSANQLKSLNTSMGGDEPTHFCVKNLDGNHTFSNPMIELANYQNFAIIEGAAAEKRLNGHIPVMIQFIKQYSQDVNGVPVQFTKITNIVPAYIEYTV